MNNNPILMSTVKMATVAANATEELAIFVAPFDCFIRKISYTDDIGITGDTTKYTILSYQRKGTAGSGTDEIATKSFTTGVDATARVPLDIGALHKSYRYIPKGTAVTYKLTVGAGTPTMAFTDGLHSVEYQRA